MLHTLLIEDAGANWPSEFFLRQPEGCYSINAICCGLVLSHRDCGNTGLPRSRKTYETFLGYEFVAQDRKIHWCPGSVSSQ